MKIPKHLSKLQSTLEKRSPMLVIVAGKQDAVLYELKNGNVERLDAFKVPRPRYSDNEGSFRVRSRGETMRSGSTREFEDEHVIRDFLKEFSRRAKNLPQNISKVFLLAPSRTKNRIPKALNTSLRNRIAVVVEGNYYYRSPLFVLERIEAVLRGDKRKEDHLRPSNYL